MKKVMKKFNRALSIMLVAAMVLTMAPQTAMPVLAATEDPVVTDVDVIDETPVADSETVVEEPSEGPETEDEEVVEVDNETPVIDEETTSEEEAIPEPEQPAEEPVVLTGENETKEITTTVSTEVLMRDMTITPASGETPEKRTLGTLTNAEIEFTKSCASADGKTVRAEKDLTFFVLPKDGYKVTAVWYALGESEEAVLDATKAETLSGTPGAESNPGSEYSLNSADIKEKKVLIAVQTEAISYTVAAGASAGTAGVTVNVLVDNALTAVGDAAAAAKTVGYTGTIKLYLTGMTANNPDNYTVEAFAGAEAATGGVELTAGAPVTDDANLADHVPYTLDVTKLTNRPKNTDSTTITIKVTAKAAAVAIGSTAAEVTPSPGTGITVEPAEIKPEAALAYGYVKYKSADDTSAYTAGQQVAFQVNHAADSKYAPVEKSDITAKLTKTGADAIPLTVNDAPRSGDVYATSDTATAYVVALSSDKVPGSGYKLEIEVKAELAETVSKTITFEQKGAPASAGQAVTIKTSQDAAATPLANTYVALPATNRVRTEGDFIWVEADPKEGYELAAINVTVTGSLDGVANAYTNTYVLGDVKDQKSIYPTNDKVTKKIDLKGVVQATDTDPEKSWVAKTVAVEVVVSSEAEGADEEKKVTFDSVTERSVSGYAADDVTSIDVRTYAYPYGVMEVEDQVTAKLNVAGETEATVAEGTAYLQFYVDAPTDPKDAIAVKVDGTALRNDILELVSKSGDRYTYRVPAKLMKDNRGTITITRPAVDVQTAAAYTNVEVTLTAKAQPTEDPAIVADDSTDNADLGAEVELVVKSKATAVNKVAPIKAVTYTVAGGTAQTATANAEGQYIINATATGNIVVTVESGTEENIYVQSGAKAATKVTGSDPVEVDYDKTITAWLENETGAVLTTLTNAVLTDAETGKLAQTEVNINTTTHKAEITIDKSEYAKVLTVTLIKADRTKVSFQIVSDEAADAVSYSKVDDGSEVKDAIELYPDTQTELKVTAAGDAAKLHYVILPAGTTEVPETSDGLSTSNENIDVTYADGLLTIKANARVEKLDDAGTIVFWADGSNKILAGSALKVAVSDPVVKGQTATIREAAKTGRMVVLQFSGHEAMKNARLVEGAIGYMVKMTLPTEKPANVTVDQWTAITTLLGDYTLENGAYVPMSALASDGSLEITVVPQKTAGGEDIPPLQISGIKVKATPVQFIDAANVADAATANTAYATEANRAIGTASEEIVISTAEAKYSDTLKMNGGSSTVLTNSNAEVSVGSPVLSNNAKNLYVRAEIIDSSTGLAHDYAGSWNAYYNAGSNQVIVKSNGASYVANAAGLYKNLAVKVTAFTEDGDYGASMVKKLTVNNGIGDIHLSVQPEILKQNNKKVTVKSTVTFNTTYNYVGGRALTAAELGKRAPKNKAVVYSLVDVPAKLQGKVEINSANGQITINDYVPTGSAADNTFTVKAADPANPATNDTASVVITSTEPAPGRVAVLEVEGRSYKEATGDLQVKQTSGQYVLAMIKSSVVKEVYTDADLMDLTNYSVKASNAKNIVLDNYYDQYYNIRVNKLGKCSFTFTAKSMTKKKAEIKNVNFVAEKTDLYAQVTQYYDSTFETAKNTGLYKAGSTITANDNTTNYFSVKFMKKVDDGGNAYHYETFALGDQNTTVSFKNAKKVTPKNAVNGVAYFAATGSTGKKATVITITNKMVKPATKFEITINNETADKVASTTAPKIAQNDKKLVLRATGGSYNVVMDVTPGKKTDSIGSGRYIMLSVDQTKKYKADPNGIFDEYLDTPILLSHKNDSLSQFTLKVNTVQDIAESYTINAAVGTMDDGVFTQEYKESKFIVKTAKANANIKVNAKYTLNPYGISKRQLVISSDYQPISMRGDVDGNYAQNQILKTGEANKFTRYFEVRRQALDGTWWIGVKENLPANILAELSDPKSIKDDLTGYITVTNGEKLIDVKLTVDLKTKEAVKFTAKAVDVIAGTNVVTDIKIMDGKEPVALAAYQVTAGSSFKAYYNASEMDSDPDLSAAEAERLANGIIRVTAASASKGTDTVTLNILPAFMADTLKVNADENKPAFSNGYQLAAKINVKEGKTTGNKIDMAAADKNWIVASSDWKNDPETVDGSVKFGWEKVNVPYSFKTSLQSTEVSKINVTSNVSYVEFASDAYNKYENEQNLTIFVNKAALLAAQKAPLGKAVTVKAKFEYANEAGAKLDIKADEVSFKITLPGTISDTTVDDFYKAVKAAAEDRNGNLRKLAESEIKKYAPISDATGTNYAAVIARGSLTNAIKEMAKGTSATFAVTGAYVHSTKTYTYTINVTGKTNSINIIVKDGWNVSEVRTKINTDYGTCDAAAAEALGLTFNPMTTADQLVAALNEVLNLPNNITLSAVVTEETKTPTATVDGKFAARVIIVDNSYEPAAKSSGISKYKAEANVSYTFTALGQASGTYFDVAHNDTTNEIYGLATVLNKATGGVSKLEELFSNAEKETGKDAIKDDVVGEDMVKALIALIEEEALKALAKNSYLGVKGIDFNTFACDYNGTNSKWEISFKITYTDDTPGATKKEVTCSVGPLDVVKTHLASQKSVSDLKNAAETAFGGYIIGYVTTKEAAIEAIRKIVVDTNKNPNYDPEKSLKVTLQVDGTGKEVGQFAAPTTDMCGKIDVTIVYDANETTPTEKDNYSFTIAKATDMDEDDPTVVDSTKINDRIKYKDRVRAFLTAEKVNEIVKGVWKADGTTTANYKSKVEDAIETALGADATAGTPLYGAGTISVSDVTVDEIQNPTGSTNDNGIIKNIEITLADSNTTPTSWAAADAKITITSITLTGGEVFQSDKEFAEAVVDYLEKTGLAAKGDYAKAFSKEDADWTADEDGNYAAKTAYTAIQTAIANIAKTVDAAEEKFATNPALKADGFTDEVEVTVPTTKANYKETGTTKKTRSVEGVTITFYKDTAAKKFTKTVNLKVRTADEMPVVEKVEITKVDTQSRDSVTHTGAFDKPFTYTAKFTDSEVTVNATVTGPNLTDAEKVITWTAKYAVDASTNKDLTDEAVPAGWKGKVSIDAETGTITIKKDAYGADFKLLLTATATGDGDAESETNNVGTAYVEIKLPEDITNSTVEVKAAVTEPDDSTTAEVVVAKNDKFEAPKVTAEGNTTRVVTFTATAACAHKKDTTKAVFTRPDDIAGKVTFAFGMTNEAQDTSKLVMTITEEMVADQTITLPIKVGTKTHDLAIKVGSADTKNLKIGFTGTDDVTWDANTNTIISGEGNSAVKAGGLMTVHDKTPGQDVKVPLNITDSTTAREWTAAKLTASAARNGAAEANAAQITFTTGTGRNDKGQLYLVISKDMLEVKAKQAKTDTEAERKPCFVTITAESTAKGGQSAITKEFTFELVVEKAVTGITITGSVGTKANDTITIANNVATITLTAEVKGTHLAAGEKGVSWEILNKAKGSGAAIDVDSGAVTGIDAATDNIITVRATSKTDKSIYKDVKIKVAP